MRIRPRFFIGGGLIVVAIGYLIFSSIRTTSEYYLTVPEVAARQAELGGQAIRVAGRVKPGNIRWDPNSLTLEFEIAPIPDLDASGAASIAAMPIPEQGLGEAINDRLRRAAAPRENAS